MEPLPGSSNGTEESHFIVQGQTQTVGFACKAGRGNPLKFTFISNIKFVWSGGEQGFVVFSPLKRTNITLSLTFALVNVHSSEDDEDEDLFFRFAASGVPLGES